MKDISTQLPHEIYQNLADAPIAWIPLGAMEFHGWHVPITLDAHTSSGLCKAAAEKAGGIILPPLHYGTYASIAGTPLTILLDQEDEDLLVRLLLKTLERLEQFGIKKAVVVSGHLSVCQEHALEKLEQQWGEKWQAMQLHIAMINKCPNLPIPADHGGLFETALLQAVNPELVHLDKLSQEEVCESNPAGAQRRNPQHPLYGIIGTDPRTMQAEQPQELLSHLTEWLCKLVE